jgi:hypothetical protein
MMAIDMQAVKIGAIQNTMGDIAQLHGEYMAFDHELVTLVMLVHELVQGHQDQMYTIMMKMIDSEMCEQQPSFGKIRFLLSTCNWLYKEEA